MVKIKSIPTYGSPNLVKSGALATFSNNASHETPILFNCYAIKIADVSIGSTRSINQSGGLLARAVRETHMLNEAMLTSSRTLYSTYVSWES
jgi:hypothetical protein